jgi:hypothetical protein
MGGWERPWEPGAVRTLDPAQLRDRVDRPLADGSMDKQLLAELNRELGDPDDRNQEAG